MPLCGYFKHGLSINTQQLSTPCCRFRLPDSQRLYGYDENVKKQFEEYHNKSLNEWLPECIECFNDEKNYGDSSRLEFNEKYADVDDNAGIKFLDLKISNTCNLQCRMCTPFSSSVWYQDMKFRPDEQWMFDDVESANVNWHRDISEIYPYLRGLETLKFTGGEPFLIPQVAKLIDDCISAGISEFINLGLITNGTIEFSEVWKQRFAAFKRVDLNISIDGVGSRYNYIRCGADWNSVEKNVLTFNNHAIAQDNIKIHIPYLPQTLNASNQQATITWAKQHNLNLHMDSPLLTPHYLSYVSLNNKLRERYNIVSDVEYSPEQFDILCTQMSILDKKYNTDFRTECPEFFE